MLTDGRTAPTQPPHLQGLPPFSFLSVLIANNKKYVIVVNQPFFSFVLKFGRRMVAELKEAEE